MNTPVPLEERNDSELGRILRNERFTQLFQPIVDAMEQRTVCYEVFTRGVYPLESPGDLFRAARGAGLLWEAEHCARRTALRRIATLRDLSGTICFLNISPEAVCDDRMTPRYILGSMEEFGLGSDSVGLEVTSPVHEAPRTFERKLLELTSAGIIFSLDDADPSVEQHMKLLDLLRPVYAKLPRKLVHNLGRFDMGQQNIRMALETLNNNGTTLVAKGLEDRDELEVLISLGIRLVQGYLVARPETKPPEIQEEFESASLRAAAALLATNRAESDCPVGEVSGMPMVVEKGRVNCEEMDRIFQDNPEVDHAVVVVESKPVGLVTRTGFYLNTGGRFGYSVFQRETVDALAQPDPMITGDGVRVTEVSRAAMGRPSHRVYDPVVVVDWSGDLVGTVTVKNLLDRTIDAERKNSGALDPLTDLPGNVSVRRKLTEAIALKAFNLILTNINGFRAFNLVHGFQNGDRMILMLAELVKKHVGTYVRDAFTGQMGQDRFAVVSFTPVPGDCLDTICREFDRRSASLLYTREEQERGTMELVTRSGSMVSFPLCTVSIAATGNHNYSDTEVSPALVLDCATSLLRKHSRDNAGEKSGFVFDARIRRARTNSAELALQDQLS